MYMQKISKVLSLIKEATIASEGDIKEREPSKEFKRGVKNTIEMVECWLEDNGITELPELSCEEAEELENKKYNK